MRSWLTLPPTKHRVQMSDGQISVLQGLEGAGGTLGHHLAGLIQKGGTLFYCSSFAITTKAPRGR